MEENTEQHKMIQNIGGNRDKRSPLEERRIKEAIEKPDIEKFHLFCRMMRIQLMLEKAVVTHVL